MAPCIRAEEEEAGREGGERERKGGPSARSQDSLKGTDPTHGGSALMLVTSEDAAADPVTPAGFQGANEGERRHTHPAHSAHASWTADLPPRLAPFHALPPFSVSSLDT